MKHWWIFLFSLPGWAQLLPALKPIPLAGVEGRIDHFAADVAGRRLFVAALGNGSVEAVDVETGARLGSIRGLKEPQGVLYEPSTKRLFVACGGDGTLRIYDGSSLAPLSTVTLGDDADNLRLDAMHRRIIAGYGKGALALLDFDGKKIGSVTLAHHPESFQLTRDGNRAFVNVPWGVGILVVDLTASTVSAKWGLGGLHANYPMALDEKNRRLIVATRIPPRLAVLDSGSGSIVARMEVGADSDDLFYDQERQRIYVIAGRGEIDVFDQRDASTYVPAGKVTTASGARTGLFVPEFGRLFVAVPHRGSQPAEIRVYRTAP